MSTSGLSSQLQDYLKKSNTENSSSSSLLQNPLSGKFGWFAAKNTSLQPQKEEEATVNGWFSEAQKDPILPSLSKKQRVLGFIGCLLMGTFCFSLIWLWKDGYSYGAEMNHDNEYQYEILNTKKITIRYISRALCLGFLSIITFLVFKASLYIPVLLLKARKFALLYTLGSLFVIFSFSLLWGPVNHLKHLLSAARLPFTVAYFGTMGATLYFALSVQSMPLTVIFAIAQVLALVWYVVSYIPGGQTGLKFFTKIFYAAASKTVQKTLPV